MKAPARLTRRQEAAWSAFWDRYPRKEGKAAARDVFAILTADGPAGGVDPDFLVRAVGRYADQCRERRVEVPYILHAKTWLRQRRFEDEVFADPPEPGTDPAAAPVSTGPNETWWPAFQAAGMDRSTYDCWIAPCTIDADDAGRPARIRAPTAFHADWLRTRLDGALRRACGGHMPEIEV